MWGKKIKKILDEKNSIIRKQNNEITNLKNINFRNKDKKKYHLFIYDI